MDGPRPLITLASLPSLHSFLNINISNSRLANFPSSSWFDKDLHREGSVNTLQCFRRCLYFQSCFYWKKKYKKKKNRQVAAAYKMSLVSHTHSLPMLLSRREKDKGQAERGWGWARGRCSSPRLATSRSNLPGLPGFLTQSDTEHIIVE